MAANPSYYQTSLVTAPVQQREHLLNLYLYQRVEGVPDSNQKKIVVPNPALANYFGITVAMDWAVYDDILPKGKLVARAQGLHLGAGMSAQKWFVSFNMVFVDDRFKGSGLKLDGTTIGPEPDQNAEWAITGGTGEFAYAQGIATFKYIPTNPGEVVRQLHIRVVCPTSTTPTTPLKVLPPVGGDGGNVVDITSKPLRLESVTICSGDVIDSISFTYINEEGVKQTAGPWGGNGGLSDTIQLAPTETVKKIMGTTGDFRGHVVVKSLTVVTNMNTYGPYGKGGGTPFAIPEKNNNRVVAFFGRAGIYLDAIGVYATASAGAAGN